MLKEKTRKIKFRFYKLVIIEKTRYSEATTCMACLFKRSKGSILNIALLTQ